MPVPHLVQGSLFVASVASLLAIILFWSQNYGTMRTNGHITMRRNASVAGLIPPALFAASFCVQPIARASEANQLPTCVAHMRSLANAMVLYTQDNEGALPPGESWLDGITSYIGPKAMTLSSCPSVKGGVGYRMNAALAGKSIEQLEVPHLTVLLFEATAQKPNEVGEQKDLSKENRHGPGVHVFATCDGTAKPYSPKQLASLRWLLKEDSHQELHG